MIDTETARTKNVRAVLAKRQIFFARLKKRGADRLLYIAGQNILYWGDSGYQNCLDYTKTDGELQAHKEEILREYRELLRSFVIASTSSNSAVLPAGGFP